MSDRSTCRSCGAPIIWAFTKEGRRIPVDYLPTPGGNLELTENGPIYGVTYVDPSSEPLYRSHFSTCKDADSWRRR